MLAFGLLLSQSEVRRSRQKKQSPHAMAKGTTTRSPAARVRHPGPTASTSPMNSCPSTSPDSMVGMIPLKRWRSEPQMAVEVTRTIASRGLRISGSGTVSTRTSRASSRILDAPRGGGDLPGLHPLLEAAQVLAHLMVAALPQQGHRRLSEPARGQLVAQQHLHLGAAPARGRGEAHRARVLD